MNVELATLAGTVAVTALALVASLVAWYRSLETYGPEMNDRARALMMYAVPPFALLTASPLVDGAIWLATGTFPTLGFAGVAVGLAGSVASLGYVYADVRSAIGDRSTDVEGTDAAA